MLVQNGSPSRSDPVAPGVRVTMVVLKNGKAEPKNPLVIFSRLPRGGWYRPQHVMYAADKQVIFIAKMCVESRSADIGTIENLLHDNRVIGFLGDEGNQRLAQEVRRLLNPSILDAFRV